MWASSGSSDHRGFHSGTARPNFSQSSLTSAAKAWRTSSLSRSLRFSRRETRFLAHARPPDDVHRADVPLAERRLGLVVGRGVLGELLHPVLAVADVELLLLEDAVDGPHPRAVGAAAHILELMSGAAVHAEVEEDEVGPGVDRVIEDVDPLVGGDARRADVGAVLDAHREGLVVLADGALHVEAEVAEETVHDRGVAELVLHDLGDDVLLLDRRRLGDPGHVAVAARQLGICLHGQQMDEVLAILRGHLVGRFQPDAPFDLRHHRRRQIAHGLLRLQHTLPALHDPYGLAFGPREPLGRGPPGAGALTLAAAVGSRRGVVAPETAGPRSGDGEDRPPRAGSGGPAARGARAPARPRTRRGAAPRPPG